SSRQFVLRLYDDLFQRPADTPGLNAWTAFLDGGASRQQVAAGLVRSSEFHALELGNLYGAMLGRPPDPQGFAAFLQFLLSGARVAQAKSIIRGSRDYFRRSGSQANSFLVPLYHDVLGRDIDPVGQAAFSSLLQQGVTRTDVAALVVNSPESHR